MDSPLVSKGFAEAELKNALYCYRLDLAYLGTNFHGWQSQPDGHTVQDFIEKSLSIITRQKIKLLGSSRTDTGVHAEHQVATFRTTKAINCEGSLKSLNALLPESIGILSLRPCKFDFHPILSAQSKVYRYRIWVGKSQHPFIKPFVWSVHKELDFHCMQRASEALIGRHDFRSFCASDSSVRSFERKIHQIKWIKRGNLIEFYILGNGFLKQMVRTIVGTLVEIGQVKRPEGDLRRILESKDRKEAGLTAPAQGLSLLRIFFDSIESIPDSLVSSGDEFGFSLSIGSLDHPT